MSLNSSKIILIFAVLAPVFVRGDRTDLPIEISHSQKIVHFCEQISSLTESCLKKQFPASNVKLRSIEFVIRQKNHFIDVDYCGNNGYDVVWHTLRFEIINGAMSRKPREGRTVSPFADAMINCLEESRTKIMKTTGTGLKLSWPVFQPHQKWLVTQGSIISGFYQEAFNNEMGADNLPECKLDEIKLSSVLKENYSAIDMTLSAEVSGLCISTRVSFKFSDGKLFFNNFDFPAYGQSDEHIAQSSNNALDSALTKWLKVVSEDPLFGGHTITPGPTHKAIGYLPDNLGKIIILRNFQNKGWRDVPQTRVVLEQNSGKIKTFLLPYYWNTAEEFNVFIFQSENGRVIQLSSQNFQFCIDWSSMRILPSANEPNRKLAGTFIPQGENDLKWRQAVPRSETDNTLKTSGLNGNQLIKKQRSHEFGGAMQN